MARETKRTRDHEEIRRWVAERGGHPATVETTVGKGQAGLRIDFSGYSGEGQLAPISWDKFFQRFDQGNLEFLYQDQTASGEPSRFNRVVTAGSESESRSRRTTSSQRSTSSRRRASRSKASARSQSKRTSTRKAARTRRTATGGRRKTTSSRRTATSSRRTQSASARSRRTVATRPRRRATQQTAEEEPTVVVGVVKTTETPTDEVIRMQDEGPDASASLGRMIVVQDRGGSKRKDINPET